MDIAKKTVLIADDNLLNLQLFSDLLKLKNIEVISLTQGEEVFEQAKKSQPNLIITDIRLGEVSGIKIIKQIKSDNVTSQIPVIAISAYVTEKDKTQLKDLGCSDYLAKPIPVNDFYKAIEKYISL